MESSGRARGGSHPSTHADGADWDMGEGYDMSCAELFQALSSMKTVQPMPMQQPDALITPRRTPPSSRSSSTVGASSAHRAAQRAELAAKAAEPASTPASGSATGAANETESQPNFFFFQLPHDVRRMIYRLWLVRAPQNIITLYQSWTEKFQRENDYGIQPVCLQLSKQTYEEGVGILYGENHFKYKLRDIQQAPQSRSWSRNWNGTKSTTINFNKFRSMFRYLEIEIEKNRSEPKYESHVEKALDVLSSESMDPEFPKPAHLHTLTLTMSPEAEKADDVNGIGHDNDQGQEDDDVLEDQEDTDASSDDDDGIGDEREAEEEDEDDAVGKALTVIPFFEPNGEIIKHLGKLATHFLHINVHTSRGQHLERTIDLRELHRPVATVVGDENVTPALLDDELARQSRARDVEYSTKALTGLHESIERACRRTKLALRTGEWLEHNEAERRREAHRALVETRVESAVTLPVVANTRNEAALAAVLGEQVAVGGNEGTQ